MICKKCKNEIDKNAVVCVHCGCKVKKPLYKKWWFWTLIVIIGISVANSNKEGTNTETASPQTENEVVEASPESIIYEPVSLRVMLDDLKANAMKAEKNYQKKHIEIEGKIANFDSDGNYITVEPSDADEWNFDTVMCYIKNEAQENLLMEKNKGDVVTIQGKVKSIGELMGYSIDIDNIK